MDVEDRPSLIICRTHIAPGAPHKQDTPEAHGAPLGEEEVRLTKRAYGWPEDESFYVPRRHSRISGRARSAARSCTPSGRSGSRHAAGEHPELARELDAARPAGAAAGLGRRGSALPRSGTMTATRKSSHTVLQWAAAQGSRARRRIGGPRAVDADHIEGADSVQAGSYGGRNLHFGVREHAMGAIVNGLTLHHLRGYGSTFLIFSDYMRASIRLAALMGLPSIFVFSHDSIGLGEDGPTHQPIEHLAGLRAMPGLAVIRPAGANETALAWRYAIAATEHPCALILSRQGVPTWNPAAVPEDAIERGAYVLRDSYREPDPPQLVLIATGSEVHICARPLTCSRLTGSQRGS